VAPRSSHRCCRRAERPRAPETTNRRRKSDEQRQKQGHANLLGPERAWEVVARLLANISQYQQNLHLRKALANGGDRHRSRAASALRERSMGLRLIDRCGAAGPARDPNGFSRARNSRGGIAVSRTG
jgi:hypothetical protein